MAPKRNISSKKKSRKQPVKAARKLSKPKSKISKIKDLSKAKFSVYINRVFKSIHPKMTISKSAMSLMNTIINDLFEKIIT